MKDDYSFEVELDPSLANATTFYQTVDLVKTSLHHGYPDDGLAVAPKPTVGAPRALMELRRGLRIGAVIRMRLDDRVMSVQVAPSTRLETVLTLGVVLAGLAGAVAAAAFFGMGFTPRYLQHLGAVAMIGGVVATVTAVLVGYGMFGRAVSSKASNVLVQEIGKQLQQALQPTFRAPR